MDKFNYKDGKLYCEDVPVAEIAEKIGTPAYIYSANTIREHYRKIEAAFSELDTTICFSIKSLANLSIMKLLKNLGSGFDVVSGGELARVQAIGGDVKKVVYAGVGKTDREISEALQAGIGWFNIESEMEFENLARLAGEINCTAHAALRINPDVYDPKTHAYTTTGKKETKFGVDIDRAGAFFEKYGKNPNVRLDSIHLHIGSPIYSPQPYIAAINKTLAFVKDMRAKGLEINTLDLGGGFAADYEEGASPLAIDYAAAIVPLLKGQGLKLILEPGRHIACNAGILLMKVLYTKKGGEKNFIIVDAAMTDNIRPALYEARHFIYPSKLEADEFPPNRRFDFQPAKGIKVNVVGGVCESADVLAKDRVLPPVKRGDLLAMFSAGAYCFTMSSQYNTRPRAAEVLVDGEKFRVIRKREDYRDIFATELDAIK
ncbi:MAG TPA: diaminopimelate decarboxylase [Phycisphaerae bacterium]|nr:diaminopimelate decarboxylase [Phycisphaerae bacterium]HPS53342.1 diaminopimelate decarboxylase [Phycisphaerae bacterium]